MPHSRPLPRFGQVDLDLGDDGSPSYGDEGLDGYDPDAPPESAARAFGREGPSRVTRRVLDDPSTRIVRGDPLAASALRGEATRVGSLDEHLLAVARGEEEAPPSSRSGQSVPSGSGVASRDGRVAAMRELYARGDADGALALATEIASERPPPPSSTESLEQSVALGAGAEIDLADPFGGLIPVLDEEDDDLPDDSPADHEMGTAIVSRESIAPAIAITSARDGVPRVVKGPAEIARLPIDHRAGFLLAHIDGMQSVEEILDVCAMPIAEALSLIDKLEQMGVIVIE